MRWLRFIALLIFVLLSAYSIPIAIKFPSVGNIVVTVIFVAIAIWVGSGFWRKSKQQQYSSQQSYPQQPYPQQPYPTPQYK